MKCEDYCCIIVVISTVLYKSHSVLVTFVYRIFDAVKHASLLVALICTTQFFYFWLLDPYCEKFSFILAQTHKVKVMSQQPLAKI
jgi:hypothetical protein